MIRRIDCAIFGLVVAAIIATATPAFAFDLAMIGTDAPPLDIEHWVQDREGAFAPVKEFAPGKVYVIELWRTGCDPCKECMPHLAELQDAYFDKGVMVIGVSDEKLERIRSFLEEQAYGVEATFGEVTKKYCLTTDPDGSVFKDYMTRAGDHGVPATFIVGKTGKIEWIGHPDGMDEPLESIVAGTWDRTSFVADDEELRAAYGAIDKALQGADPQQAIALVDKMIADTTRPGVKRRLEEFKEMVETNLTKMAGVAAPARAFDRLIIGSNAPPLDIEHWVQDREGAFAPVKEFAPGKVYVIEFWATWCGPCITSMPHLAELQDAYFDKGVTVIGVSDEKVEEVRSFLEQKASDAGTTFGEITRKYSLTTDPDRSVHMGYMAAAQQGGIPTAFIVGKTGKIEWIGHPNDMDEPLESIVAGTWDRTSLVADEEEWRALRPALIAVQKAVQGEDPQQAVTLVDTMIIDVTRPGVKRRLEKLRGSVEDIVKKKRADEARTRDAPNDAGG